MVRKAFADRYEREHLAMITALLEACEFCDQLENREPLIETLSKARYVGAPVNVIRASLGEHYDLGNGRAEQIPDFHIFYRGGANEPTRERALWVIRSLHASGLVPEPQLVPTSAAPEWFRVDLFHRASQLLKVTSPG